MDERELTTLLIGLPIPQVRWFDSIGSTNDEALNWAQAGALDGALVVADEQLQGRGRFDRRWVTRAGAALAFSIVFRPSLYEQKHLGMFSPLGALGVRQTLMALGLPVEIKWPNDVLIQRRKVCGILAEASWLGDQLQAVVLGIGINIRPDAVPQLDGINFPAGSVEWALGQSVDRFDLLRKILAAIFEWRATLGSDLFYTTWQSALAFRGEMVRVDGVAVEPLVGRLEGIDTQGNLNLRLADGNLVTVTVGDVHLRLENQAGY